MARGHGLERNWQAMDEKKRLEALNAYDLISSPAEGAFNNLSAIIAHVFKMPIALISLVGEDRVFFKGNLGMPGVESFTRTSSLCSHAINNNDITIYDNSAQHPFPLYNPVETTTSGVKFYAAAPLKSKDGCNIGVVCVADKEPRIFSPDEQILLKSFAVTVMDEIEMRAGANDKAAELQIEVNRRTAELQVANAELERSNKELEQFAFIASHDLQEPLRKIQTFSARLIEKYNDQLDKDGKLYIEKIQKSTARMNDLIRDLLQFARVHELTGEFQTTDLNSILISVLQHLDLSISQKKAIVNFDPIPIIYAIPMQIDQLCYNLLNNALKFTKVGVPPVINISCKPVNNETIKCFPKLNQDKEHLEIIIQDNGIGFNQKHAQNIFALFTRLNGLSEYDGTGIGLAICKKIVQNHQGEIYAEGKEDEGATFHIILPAAA